MKVWAASLVAATTVLLLLASGALPPLRSVNSPISEGVEAYYVDNAVRDMDTPNIVSAVLADYRGYDTFGETTVVFAAGLACYLLLRRPL